MKRRHAEKLNKKIINNKKEEYPTLIHFVLIIIIIIIRINKLHKRFAKPLRALNFSGKIKTIHYKYKSLCSLLLSILIIWCIKELQNWKKIVEINTVISINRSICIIFLDKKWILVILRTNTIFSEIIEK